MSSSNRSFVELSQDERLLIVWVCTHLVDTDRVPIEWSQVRAEVFAGRSLSDMELSNLLHGGLQTAPYLSIELSGAQLSVCKAPDTESRAEPPLSLLLKGQLTNIAGYLDATRDDQSLDLPQVTRLEKIIAQATAHIREERKQRRCFVRRDTRILSMYNPYNYLLACRWTREGKVVLWPNEVTYGLTTNALMDDSVQAIYDAKGRVANPIPILTCKGWIHHFGRVPRLAQELVDELWPDNISIVVQKHRELVSDLVTAGIQSVALMCPNEQAEQLAFDVCDSGNYVIPIACTSANISGQKSITDAPSAIDKFFGAVDLILTGPESTVGVNTTIVDFSQEPYTLLRQGPVSLAEIYHAVPELEGRIVDCTKK